MRNAKRLEQNKKVSEKDEQYFNQAERRLYNELSISLQLSFDDTKQYIFEKTENYGVDAVFMTSGADKAIEFALKMVRNGGKILVFASTPKNFGYANNEIYYRELTVLGSYSPAPSDLRESLDLLKSGKVKVKNLSTVYEFDKINEAFKDTIANKILKAYIKIS